VSVSPNGLANGRGAVPVALRTLGRPGLHLYAGHVVETRLREFQGDRWVATLAEMIEMDAVIGGILQAIELLIRQVDFTIEPGDDSQEALDDADFIQECLDDMSFSWADTLSEILTFLPFGWAFMEITYKLRGGDVDNPTQRSLYDDGKVGWRKWSLRGQETRTRWEIDSEGGIQGMWQRTPPTYEEVLIPIWKALLFRTNTRLNNPEGRSILRNAYTPWYYKTNIQRIEAVGIERDLAGLPVAWVPSDYMTPNAPDDKKAVYSMIQQIVTQIRQDESAGLVMPLAYDENGNRQFLLELIASSGSRQFDTNTVIERYDKAITLAALADFMLLGHGQIGSFALASSKTDLFAMAIGAHLNTICSTVNQFEIPRILRYNGRKPKVLPRMVAGDIETVDLGELGSYVTALAGVGVDFTSEEMQTHLLDQANLPTTSAGVVADYPGSQPDSGNSDSQDPGSQDPNSPDSTSGYPQAASELEAFLEGAEFYTTAPFDDPDDPIFGDD
jgi:hypothetical protein